MPIILASQSPQRRLLMETLGIPFEVIPANIDEVAITHTDPIKRAALVAQAKAQTVAKMYQKSSPQGLPSIIAADTFLLFNDQYLEKPATPDAALAMLTQLTGKQARTLTGFCYLDLKRSYEFTTTLVNTVQFATLSTAHLEQYVQSNPVTTWSGGFSPAYHAGAGLIEWVEGSFTSFTHGLPLPLVVEKLRESGILI